MTPEPPPLSREQLVQEGEYAFPYHYVARFGPGGFGQAFYDSWGISYVSGIELVLERLALAEAASVVDIGCGDGRLTRELALRAPGRRVAGIDYSARALALARAMNADLSGLAFHQLDIVAEPWQEAPFEAAVLMEVLEHIPPLSVPRFVQAARRLLVPGGLLVLTVPHENVPVEPKHFRHFDSAAIRSVLEPEFRIEGITPFERGGRARRTVCALLGNRFFILNHPRLLNALYAWYKKRLLICAEEDCRRLLVVARAA